MNKSLDQISDIHGPKENMFNLSNKSLDLSVMLKKLNEPTKRQEPEFLKQLQKKEERDNCLIF